MKILYYYPEYDTPMYAWQRVHIFDELERHGIKIDAFNPLLCDNYDEANDKILSIAKAKRYDLFMTCVCSEKMLYYSTLKEIKKIGLPTLSFRPDNLVMPYNDKNLASSFDLLWLTSAETQYLYKDWNAKTIFLPYAANPYAFKPTGNNILRRICFVGRPYGTRPMMINTLTTNNIFVDLYCKGNTNVYAQNDFSLKQNIILPSPYQVFTGRLKFKEGRKMLYSSALSRIKRSTVLNENDYLNYRSALPCGELYKPYSTYCLSLAATSAANSDIMKNPIKIVQLRIFEIPMSGGVEFCRFSEEIAGYFESDKEIIFYTDFEEMVDKARYYTQKAPESEIVNIMKAARRRSESEHTWFNRFSKVFQILNIE